MTLGEKLLQLRKSKGLSQEQLAAQITVSRQAVSKWELGEATPDTENIIQLSKIFEVSIDYLLHDEFVISSTASGVVVHADASAQTEAETTSDARYLPKWVLMIGRLSVVSFFLSAAYLFTSSLLNHYSFRIYDNILLLAIAIMLLGTIRFLGCKVKRKQLAEYQILKEINGKTIVLFTICTFVPLGIHIYNLANHGLNYLAHIILFSCLIAPLIIWGRRNANARRHGETFNIYAVFMLRWMSWVNIICLGFTFCIVVFSICFLLFINRTPITPFINVLLTALPYLPVVLFSLIHNKAS